MPAKATPLRIVWAVDPSGQSSLFSKSIASVLRYFLRYDGTVVEPVHVLRLAPEVSADFSAKWVPEYCDALEDELDRLTRSLKVRDSTPPRVIIHESLSTRGAVDALSRHAVRTHADLIVAQSHGRRRASRAFLGSFAETLLFRSKVPVLLLGKEMGEFKGLRNILFPTDFGKTARAQLQLVLRWAAALDSKVTLFHSVQFPIEPMWTAFFEPGPLGAFSDYVQGRIDFAKRRADHWARLAKARGVRMDVMIDEHGLDVPSRILAIARARNVDLIAMESRSGPGSSSLLGSATRHVLRHAPCPVLVLKPQAAIGIVPLPRPGAAAAPKRAA